jgi:membrane-associated phospholipid phosphatase
MSLSIKSSLRILKDNDVVIARWTSHIISPHIVGVILTSMITLRYSQDPSMAFLWLLVLLPVLVLPPLGYVMWLVRQGKLADIYMPDRETRLRPLTVMMVWALICWLFTRHFGAPPVVEVFVLSTAIMIGLLSLVTLFWKISFHAAAITAAAITMLLVSGSSAWPVVVLIPVVGWARVRLGRHTPRQVIFGAVMGAFIALLLAQGILIKVL